MKIRITEKDLKEQCEIVLGIGYCRGQNLIDLSTAHELGYTSGMYGWKSDLYIYRTKSGLYVIISTGYSPVSNRKVVDIEPYEKRAKKTRYDRGLSFEEKRREINNLFDQWVMASIEENIKRNK